MTRFHWPPSAGRRVLGPPHLLPLLVLVLVGCDTVAELSIEQRDFRSVVSDGVIGAGSCGVGASDTEFRLRFAPLDGDQVVIAPGELVNGQLIAVGDNFTEQDVEFVSSVLYPVPDVACSGDGDCAAIPGGFTCQSINPANPSGAATVCGRGVALETLQRPLVYDEGGRDRSLGLIMDYSATLAGIDADGNFDPSRSTDPRDQRVAAARLFAVSYANSSFGPDSEGCVASFGGEDVGGVFFDPTPTTCLTDDFDDLSDRLAGLSIGEQGRSPVWAALEESITGQLATANGDRIIVMFTDGADDSSVTANFDSVLAAAAANAVTVHIVHLDNPPAGITRTGPIDDFARLACATGGSYQYSTSPNDLRNYFDVLANTVPSGYEVQGQAIALADAALAEGCYRMATGVRITLAGQTITMQFAGDKTDPATLQVIDDRLVVCKRPVPAPPVSTEGDGGAGGTSEQ